MQIYSNFAAQPTTACLPSPTLSLTPAARTVRWRLQLGLNAFLLLAES